MRLTYLCNWKILYLLSSPARYLLLLFVLNNNQIHWADDIICWKAWKTTESHYRSCRLFLLLFFFLKKELWSFCLISPFSYHFTDHMSACFTPDTIFQTSLLIPLLTFLMQLTVFSPQFFSSYLRKICLPLFVPLVRKKGANPDFSV